MKGLGAKPRVLSRCSAKENRQQQEKPAHFQINMAAAKANAAGLRENRLGSPTNQQQQLTASNSLEKPLKESLNFSGAGRQSVVSILSKSTSKLGGVRPRIDFLPSSTKHHDAHSKSFLRGKQNSHPNKLTVKGALSRALFEASKYSYEGLHDGIDNCLQELEQEVESNDREAIGLVRLLMEKVFEKQHQHFRQKLDALEEAQQLAKLYKEELKRKGRQLLWLKQQVDCLQEPQKRSKSPKLFPQDDPPLSETDESSICSYIVSPAEPQQPSSKHLNDELRNKLRLNIRKVRESQDGCHQNPSD